MRNRVRFASSFVAAEPAETRVLVGRGGRGRLDGVLNILREAGCS